VGAIGPNDFPRQANGVRTGERRSCQFANRSGRHWTPDRYFSINRGSINRGAPHRQYPRSAVERPAGRGARPDHMRKSGADQRGW